MKKVDPTVDKAQGFKNVGLISPFMKKRLPVLDNEDRPSNSSTRSADGSGERYAIF